MLPDWGTVHTGPLGSRDLGMDFHDITQWFPGGPVAGIRCFHGITHPEIKGPQDSSGRSGCWLPSGLGGFTYHETTPQGVTRALEVLCKNTGEALQGP